MRYNHDDKIDTYTNWQQAQKIPINRGFFIEDLRKVEVAPWEHKGGLGAFVNLDGAGGTNDGYVCEIPPGKQLRAQKHLYEEMVYILEGTERPRLAKDGKKHTFRWHPGSHCSSPTPNPSTAKAMPADILPSPTPVHDELFTTWISFLAMASRSPTVFAEEGNISAEALGPQLKSTSCQRAIFNCMTGKSAAPAAECELRLPATLWVISVGSSRPL
jgi:hypothetical protein